MTVPRPSTNQTPGRLRRLYGGRPRARKARAEAYGRAVRGLLARLGVKAIPPHVEALVARYGFHALDLETLARQARETGDPALRQEARQLEDRLDRLESRIAGLTARQQAEPLDPEPGPRVPTPWELVGQEPAARGLLPEDQAAGGGQRVAEPEDGHDQ